MKTAHRHTATRRRARPQWRPLPRAGGGNEMDRENSMRAIGLVLLSIAIMALLLTDADAKRRRSSAQGSQAAASRSSCATHGRKGISDNCSGFVRECAIVEHKTRVNPPKTRVNPPKTRVNPPSKTIFIADSLKAHRNSRKAGAHSY